MDESDGYGDGQGGGPRGPNWEQNQQWRLAQAARRAHDWANTLPGTVPDSVRRKAEKRKLQRERALAIRQSQAIDAPASPPSPAPAPAPQTAEVEGEFAYGRSRPIPQWLLDWQAATNTPTSQDEYWNGIGDEHTTKATRIAQPSSKSLATSRSYSSRDPAPPPEVDLPSASSVEHQFELPPWRQPLYNAMQLQALFIQSHCQSECCWNELCGTEDGDSATHHIDCTGFVDQRTGHDGRLLFIQERLIEHHLDRFREILRQVKSFMEIDAADSGVCHIHFWCRRGKHRSVACAELVACTVRTAIPTIEIDVLHKGLLMHNRRCDCPECDHGRERRSKTLARAFEKL
jgi:hypothetical protein